MKKLYFNLLLILFSITSFSQPFYVYTATTSGMWTQASNWTVTARTDGFEKHKVIIPAGINITADNTVDHLGLGDVQLQIMGVLTILPSTNLNFSENTSIELINGSIVGLLVNQKIKIGDEIKYKGSEDGTITGNYYADNTTGTSPNGFRSLSSLPVNFTSFYVSKSGTAIQLTWSTDREINSSRFEIERSFNGVDWQNIASANAAGNSSNNNNYSYNDKNLSGPVVYYRIRQVDIDGRSVYSSIKTIRSNEAISPLKIYAAEKNVVIDLNQAVKNKLVVTVINTNGQVLNRQTFANPQYKIKLQLNNVITGTYIVNVNDNNGLNMTTKIVL